MTVSPVEASANAVADLIRMRIEDDILGGRLAPGQRVNADEIARAAGVSHIPVREALRALETDGWVTRRHHRGTTVRTRDAAELADLFEARMLVEPAVARLAALRRSPEHLASLDVLLATQEAVTDAADLARVNCDFHVALARSSGNDLLAGAVTALNKRVRFYYVPAAHERRAVSLREHRAILDAVRARDGEAAARILTAHIADTRVSADRSAGSRR